MSTFFGFGFAVALGCAPDAFVPCRAVDRVGEEPDANTDPAIVTPATASTIPVTESTSAALRTAEFLPIGDRNVVLWFGAGGTRVWRG